MILLADSGSTKTHWCYGEKGIHSQRITTRGINPFLQAKEEIEQILTEELIPHLTDVSSIHQIYFYGAGCTPQKSVIVKSCLQTCFSNATTLEVNSDLLGAARALCQHQAAIACILGTGSNSCLYDGEQILQNISPLGYILGDEGSGAVLGRTLLGDCLKKQLPEDLIQSFFSTYSFTPEQLLNKVYREPMPNRFMASLAPFLSAHREVPEIHRMLTEQFSRFFQRNVMQYDFHSYPIHFTGSIAWYFQEEISEAARNLGLQLGRFLQSPIEGLIQYHEME